jgi:hexosaminidase
MMLHKLNVLHWHLTDDQGWRLEIARSPRLPAVGAWRIPAHAPAGAGPERRYGGYYTQEEVRGIVAYAARRHITIVPEIEMPGHAQAAIAAYPELGTDDAPPGLPVSPVSPDWGIHNYLFNVEAATFEVLENVLDEVMALFPGEFIHVGGDEAVKERWQQSERVQARMRELGIADETGLQSWFIRRIEEYLNRHGRRLIGWDEILEGGLAPNATVMSWRGIDGALAAATQGHDTVLTPAPTLYFDHRQSALPGEPPGRGPVISLADVYAFEPLPEALEAREHRHVLGVQANLWSEHIRTPERLAYMAFPRAAAVAELGWSSPDRRSWTGFLERLAVQFDRYRTLGLPFATSAFDVRVAATHVDGSDDVTVELSNQAGFGTIRYATDGSEVTPESAQYDGPLTVPSSATLATAVFHDGALLAQADHGNVDLLVSRRYSQQLDLCSEGIALQLEDDAPVEGDRSVFLLDIMNPCWVWPDADLSRAKRVDVAVGQLPFNFQIGELRQQIELRRPQAEGGELEVRAGGCDGTVVATVALREAAGNDAVTILSTPLDSAGASRADLCFRFNTSALEPMWAIESVTLRPTPGHGT